MEKSVFKFQIVFDGVNVMQSRGITPIKVAFERLKKSLEMAGEKLEDFEQMSGRTYVDSEGHRVVQFQLVKAEA